jgi:hypothetical protein
MGKIANNPDIQDSRDYVLWIRVSTKKQGLSNLGLEAQVAYAKAFTGKDPVETFKDVYSGQKLDKCKSLWDAIDYCKAHGTYLLIAKTDRFRNVEEACKVLRVCGEGNLRFCDLPTVNELILKIMWSVWEAQAKMGQINTKLAMAEIKKKIERDGGFETKDGLWRTHLGREKGCDNTESGIKAGIAISEAANARRLRDSAYILAASLLRNNVPRKDILRQLNELHETNPEIYSAPGGGPFERYHISRWARLVLRDLKTK